MADLIDRQAAIKAIHDEFDECLVWDESGQHTADEVENILTSLPSVDAQPVKHGRWERKNDGVYCSECHLGWDFIRGVPSEAENYRYCPICGARMDREE